MEINKNVFGMNYVNRRIYAKNNCNMKNNRNNYL